MRAYMYINGICVDMLFRMAAYDPSFILNDGTIPAGGFATHLACANACTLVPMPPVAEAAIALLPTDDEKDAAYNKWSMYYSICLAVANKYAAGVELQATYRSSRENVLRQLQRHTAGMAPVGGGPPHVPTYKPKPPKLDACDIFGTKVDVYLQNVAMYLQNYNLTNDGDIANVYVNNLTQASREHLFNVHPLTDVAFYASSAQVISFLNSFANQSDRASLALSKLRGLSMKGTGLLKYYQEFTKLLAAIGWAPNQVESVRFFVEGLNADALPGSLKLAIFDLSQAAGVSIMNIFSAADSKLVMHHGPNYASKSSNAAANAGTHKKEPWELQGWQKKKDKSAQGKRTQGKDWVPKNKQESRGPNPKKEGNRGGGGRAAKPGAKPGFVQFPKCTNCGCHHEDPPELCHKLHTKEGVPIPGAQARRDKIFGKGPAKKPRVNTVGASGEGPATRLGINAVFKPVLLPNVVDPSQEDNMSEGEFFTPTGGAMYDTTLGVVSPVPAVGPIPAADPPVQVPQVEPMDVEEPAANIAPPELAPPTPPFRQPLRTSPRPNKGISNKKNTSRRPHR